MLGRGLLRRCANCGGGDLFETWFRMRPCCPSCQHRFEREEGFFLGAYVVNLAVAEGLILLLVITPTIYLGATRPGFDVLPLLAIGLVAAVVAPFAYYPFSRTIWVALEMMLRPAGASEPSDRARPIPPGQLPTSPGGGDADGA